MRSPFFTRLRQLPRERYIYRFRPHSAAKMSNPNQSKPNFDFNSTVLPDFSPFRVNPDDFETVRKTSNEGRPYDTIILTISPKRSTRTFRVECFRRDAERLRALAYLNPDGYLNASFKPKTSEEAYDELIFATENQTSK